MLDLQRNAELARIEEDTARAKNWKRFGPYLAERQWGTVREDYSASGNCWEYFPHDHARSRVYRWGEDGLLGICDRQGRLCFALALWNERDSIVKERLFGLTGPEGNHGEDVKECYYYLDSTPTHSYMKALYKYPQRAFPYAELVDENRRRGKLDPEYELADTGAFDGDRYFDVSVEYAKASPEDILIQVTVANRGPEPSPLHLLPTLWFRNTWSWGRTGEGYSAKPTMLSEPGAILAEHAAFGSYRLAMQPDPSRLLFTENETNAERLYGTPNRTPYVKDGFHAYLVEGKRDAVNPEQIGTKAAAHYALMVPARSQTVVRLRLSALAEAKAQAKPFATFDSILDARRKEADAFYGARMDSGLTEDEARVVRQGYAGLLWSKQFYHYDLRAWLEGDPAQPPPPPERTHGRNATWTHLYNRDVISMPDKWEYPWYAAWDLAFHMIPLSRIDPNFAKEQLNLFVREWYMHPNGQLPAYEFAFDDVNPPVHAWATWRVYKVSGKRGARDRAFLVRMFHKLLLNFTWWVNRKDAEGRHLFSGGFLGLDNIGVFDRSRPLPTGGHLEQADGTAWMAFYCATMLSMALELAQHDPAYDEIASKFFEHFVGIADAINTLGGTGLWAEDDGFYYDQLHLGDRSIPLRIRSLVGLLPLLAVEVLENSIIDRLPKFKQRMRWFIEHRQDLSRHIAFAQPYCNKDQHAHDHMLLAIPSASRLQRVLRYLLDENEFLSPYGIRSLSRVHAERPYVFFHEGQEFRVDYDPAESRSGLFGGNSNWRGPIWMPINYLLIEALERYHHFYGPCFEVECPTGSGRMMNLAEVARDLAARLARIFLPGKDGQRPCNGGDLRYANDPHWKDLVLFYEYFHGDTGRGVGASHQTGWTALALRMVEDAARRRG